MSQKIELLPCPFCGGEPQLLHNSYGIETRSYIKCMGCEVTTRGFMISTDHSCDDEAIEAWNRRADNAKPMVVEED